jgi:phosphoribosylanthranilate isomerase
MKAIAVRDHTDLEKAKSYIGIADYFLFDAKPPKGADLPGGNGVAFDWEIMDDWPQTVPYVLSGGLGIDNIADAIEQSGAWGIDLSSGVETSPGVKNENMIREILQIATQKERSVE